MIFTIYHAHYDSVAKLKLYAHLYKTIKANIVLTVKSFVSINYFRFQYKYYMILILQQNHFYVGYTCIQYIHRIHGIYCI